VVPGAPKSADVRPDLPSSRELRIEYGLLTNNGRGGRRDAIRQLARKYQVTAKAIYQLLEEGKDSGN
jgi:hypothetical protein